MNMGVNPLALVVSFACIVLAITARLWVPGEGAAFVWVIGVLALVGILAPFAMRMPFSSGSSAASPSIAGATASIAEARSYALHVSITRS